MYPPTYDVLRALGLDDLGVDQYYDDWWQQKRAAVVPQVRKVRVRSEWADLGHFLAEVVVLEPEGLLPSHVALFTAECGAYAGGQLAGNPVRECWEWVRANLPWLNS